MDDVVSGKHFVLTEIYVRDRCPRLVIRHNYEIPVNKSCRYCSFHYAPAQTSVNETRARGTLYEYFIFYATFITRT